MKLISLRRYKMIKIKIRNKDIVFWNKTSYDDYMYDGSYFIIMKNGQWIGFYNLDCIEYIVVEEGE